jgi:hypothetical protein
MLRGASSLAAEDQMSALKVASSFVLGLGLASCSSGAENQATQSPPEFAIVQSPTSVVQVSVDGSRIEGPNVMLERFDGSLRGRGPSGVVDLRREGNSLRGTIGNGPTELYLEPLDDGFVLRGMYSGVLGRLDIRTDRIEGQLGRCQYSLRRYPSELGVAYSGRRICRRGFFEPATLTLSPAVASLEPIDRAAITAILLGR